MNLGPGKAAIAHERIVPLPRVDDWVSADDAVGDVVGAAFPGINEVGAKSGIQHFAKGRRRVNAQSVGAGVIELLDSDHVGFEYLENANGKRLIVLDVAIEVCAHHAQVDA